MEPSQTRKGRATSGPDERDWAPTPQPPEAPRENLDAEDRAPAAPTPISDAPFSAPPVADRTPAWGAANGAKPYPLAPPTPSPREARGERTVDVAGAVSLFANQSNPFDPTDPEAERPTRMPTRSAQRLEALGQRMDLIAISPDRAFPESPNPSGAIEILVDPGAIQPDLWDPQPRPARPPTGTVTIADTREPELRAPVVDGIDDEVDVWAPATGHIAHATAASGGTTIGDRVDRGDRVSVLDERSGFNFHSDADTSDRPMLRGGPRWYRKQIRNFGVIAGLIPMFALGAGAWMVLAVSSATLSGTIGLILGTSAAPGLLVAGAPFGSASSYPIAAICSIPLWLLLGWWATRRTLAEPMPNWHDYIVNLAWLTGAVVLGATIAIIASSVYLDQPLLN